MKNLDHSNSEFDLALIPFGIKRYKYVFVSLPLLLLSISGIYLSRATRSWSGEFDILIKSDSTQISSSMGVTSLLGLTASSNQLKTEVEILKSPSVLKPAYLYAKKNHNIPSSLSFRDWVNSSLKIYLLPDTSILKVEYTSTDRESLVPVLSYISKTYKNFSLEKSRSPIDSALSDTISQLADYQVKYKKASQKLDAFSLANGIPLGFNQSVTPTSLADSQTSGIKPEIDSQAVLDDLYSSSPLLKPNSISSKGALGSDALRKLASINYELHQKRRLYTDSNPVIQDLLSEKSSIEAYINNTAGGLFTPSSPRLAKDKLLHYRDLSLEVSTLSSVVNSLASRINLLKLEQSKSIKDWQVISSPIVNPVPASPRPFRLLAGSLAAGLFSSVVLISFLIHKKRYIISPRTLFSHIDSKLVKEITPDQLNKILQEDQSFDSEIADHRLDIIASCSDVVKHHLNHLAKNHSNLRIVSENDVITSPRCIFVFESGHVCEAYLKLRVNDALIASSEICSVYWLYAR